MKTPAREKPVTFAAKDKWEFRSPLPPPPEGGGDPLKSVYNRPNALSPLPSGEGWGGAKLSFIQTHYD